MKWYSMTLPLLLAASAPLSCGAGDSEPTPSGAAGSPSDGGPSCDTARRALLNPVDSLSGGSVSVVSQSGGETLLYVDASAGGFMAAPNNPYIYLKLSDLSQQTLTDPAAGVSTSWDLALKRDVIRTNSADSGPGNGGAARVSGKSFADVGSSDAASFHTDEFLDDHCNPNVDQSNKPITAFSDWYEYDGASMTLAPKPLVFVVRGADGTSFYKLEIVNYYSLPDGGTGMASAFYTLRVAKL